MILLVNGHCPPVDDTVPFQEPLHVVTTRKMWSRFSTHSVNLCCPWSRSGWIISHCSFEVVLDEVLNLIALRFKMLC